MRLARGDVSQRLQQSVPYAESTHRQEYAPPAKGQRPEASEDASENGRSGGHEG